MQGVSQCTVVTSRGTCPYGVEFGTGEINSCNVTRSFNADDSRKWAKDGPDKGLSKIQRTDFARLSTSYPRIMPNSPEHAGG